MTTTLRRAALFCAVAASVFALAACSPQGAAKDDGAAPTESAAAEPAKPEAVNGWREYPLREGVIAMQPFRWRTDSINIPVKAGADLEYKLEMKKGQGIVYSINFVDVVDPKVMVSEFHGHTEKGADGTGDLMYYSKTGATNESGVFLPPWDGIHGWYLKNESDKDITVKLDVAGFYKRTDQ
jgi:hypothetical protein